MSLDSEGGGPRWGWGDTKLVRGDFINMGEPSHEIGSKTLASTLRGVTTLALRKLGSH